jgi:uncharacterized protein (UPF0333 family)
MVGKMEILKKLYSRKGQLSMEMGLLISAAILVSVVIAYYYTDNTKSVAEKVGETANNNTESLGNDTDTILDKLGEQLNDLS